MKTSLEQKDKQILEEIIETKIIDMDIKDLTQLAPAAQVAVIIGTAAFACVGIWMFFKFLITCIKEM